MRLPEQRVGPLSVKKHNTGRAPARSGPPRWRKQKPLRRRRGFAIHLTARITPGA